MIASAETTFHGYVDWITDLSFTFISINVFSWKYTSFEVGFPTHGGVGFDLIEFKFRHEV